jgi:hypothetical protein
MKKGAWIKIEPEGRGRVGIGSGIRRKVVLESCTLAKCLLGLIIVWFHAEIF